MKYLIILLLICSTASAQTKGIDSIINVSIQAAISPVKTQLTTANAAIATANTAIARLTKTADSLRSRVTVIEKDTLTISGFYPLKIISDSASIKFYYKP